MHLSELSRLLARLREEDRLRIPDDELLAISLKKRFGVRFIDAASNDYLGMAELGTATDSPFPSAASPASQPDVAATGGSSFHVKRTTPAPSGGPQKPAGTAAPEGRPTDAVSRETFEGLNGQQPEESPPSDSPHRPKREAPRGVAPRGVPVLDAPPPGGLPPGGPWSPGGGPTGTLRRPTGEQSASSTPGHASSEVVRADGAFGVMREGAAAAASNEVDEEPFVEGQTMPGWTPKRFVPWSSREPRPGGPGTWNPLPDEDSLASSDADASGRAGTGNSQVALVVGESSSPGAGMAPSPAVASESGDGPSDVGDASGRAGSDSQAVVGESSSPTARRAPGSGVASGSREGSSLAPGRVSPGSGPGSAAVSGGRWSPSSESLFRSEYGTWIGVAPHQNDPSVPAVAAVPAAPADAPSSPSSASRAADSSASRPQPAQTSSVSTAASPALSPVAAAQPLSAPAPSASSFAGGAPRWPGVAPASSSAAPPGPDQASSLPGVARDSSPPGDDLSSSVPRPLAQRATTHPRSLSGLLPAFPSSFESAPRTLSGVAPPSVTGLSPEAVPSGGPHATSELRSKSHSLPGLSEEEGTPSTSSIGSGVEPASAHEIQSKPARASAAAPFKTRGMDIAVSRETSEQLPARSAHPSLGAGASRLVFGTAAEHVRAERAVAHWLGLEEALLFTSGYAANVGALAALLSADDAVFSDTLNHASLIDGIRLSAARAQVFSHLNLTELERQLSRAGNAPARWVVTESYYSMDGDGPDLAELRELCDRHDAHLYVDEAHSIGTFGEEGRGLCAQAGIVPDVLMAGFGKALGLQGACILGRDPLRTWLWNRARSFVFSTAGSPWLAGVLEQRVDLVRSMESERQRLEEVSYRVRHELTQQGVLLPTGSFGPVLSIVVGAERATLHLAERLREVGILTQAVRPPTVPVGQSRIRLVLRASFSDAQCERLVREVTGQIKHAQKSSE